MVQSSYLDVFSISTDRGYDETIQVGDVVRTGPNLYPHYSVICIDGDKAWVRNVGNGADGITNLAQCRKVDAASAANGAPYDPADSRAVRPYPGR
jgi:hypothetical protein